MRRVLLVSAAFFLVVANVSAQYYTNQNKIWAFGFGAGVDFTSGVPVPIKTSVHAEEGTASVSDPFGNLLFYTDGKKAWDRANTSMGSVGFGNTSSSQAAVIIPVIGNPNQYYVFGSQAMDRYVWPVAGFEDSLAPRMSYGIVDMSMNGGMGGIVPGSVNELANKMTEKQVAITGDNNDIWLLTHKRDSTLFYAYHITVAGLDTIPVISNAGTMKGYCAYCAGVMKCSADRRRLVVQNYITYADSTFTVGLSAQVGTELFDFDPSSGLVSNCFRVVTGESEYGAEFSPGGTKLYTMSLNYISQYDLSHGTSHIMGSREYTVLDATSSDLRTGPDGKIYFLKFHSSHSYLDCISNPDSPRFACNYIPKAVQLLDSTQGYIGLPSLYVTTDTVNRAFVNSIEPNATIFINPNPVQNMLNISAPYTITSVAVSNNIGQVILKRDYSAKNVIINVADLPMGIYLLRINGIEVKKFLKE